jgi:chromosome segregation ATPase
LAVLLLSLPLYSQDAGSEDTYEITEAELTELETILSEQATTIETQRETLTELQQTIRNQRDTLTTLSTTIETQQTTISALEQSFSEYEREARRVMIRNTAIGFTIGVGAGAGIAGLLMAVIQ